MMIEKLVSLRAEAYNIMRDRVMLGIATAQRNGVSALSVSRFSPRMMESLAPDLQREGYDAFFRVSTDGASIDIMWDDRGSEE